MCWFIGRRVIITNKIGRNSWQPSTKLLWTFQSSYIIFGLVSTGFVDSLFPQTRLYYTILYYTILLGDIQKYVRWKYKFPNEKLGAEKREKNFFFKLSKKDQCFLHRYYICNDKNIYKFIKKTLNEKKNVCAFLIKTPLYAGLSSK